MQNGELETLITRSLKLDIFLISWIYALFVAIYANFHLKRKVVSNNTTDPGLSRGWAYFIEEGVYKQFLDDKIDVPPRGEVTFTLCLSVVDSL
jgi:hypothetical protein